MFTRLFLEHPRSIGESYLEHQRCALVFGLSLVAAGLACVVHALVPGLFVRTGSDAITRLNAQMIARRARTAGVSCPAEGSPSSISAQRHFT